MGEPSSRWPVNVRARATLEGNPRARELAETAERSKWLQELRDIVISANLPIVQLMSTMQHPETVLSGVGRGRRANTLRRRVLDWKRASRKFTLTIGSSWPRGAGDVIDYVATWSMATQASPYCKQVLLSLLRLFEEIALDTARPMFEEILLDTASMWSVRGGRSKPSFFGRPCVFAFSWQR